MNPNEVLPESFCEGKQIPGLVPGFHEFFSSITGLFIMMIGIAGILQPRMEVILKQMYAGIIVSGVGTFLLHMQRIAAFNLADVFPLLITLTLGLIAFFDEVVAELRRPKEMAPWDFRKILEEDQVKAILDMIFYTFWVSYLVGGLILIVFPPVPDIFSLYFGPPYAVVATGGMVYLYLTQRTREAMTQLSFPLPQKGQCRPLLSLLILAVATAFLAVLFKLLDSFACSPVLVWFFPHPLFHILLSFSTHCVIVYLGFYRSLNYAKGNDKQHPPGEVKWFLKFFPYFYIPKPEEAQ